MAHVTSSQADLTEYRGVWMKRSDQRITISHTEAAQHESAEAFVVPET